MDYSNIIKELEQASLFDLYRLNSAINQELDNSTKIQEVKQFLRVGECVDYFNSTTNRLIEAKIIALNRTRCLVENLHDKVKWNIMYASINTENVKIDIDTNQKVGLKKSELQVGEAVTFLDKDNNQRHGIVQRLNQKTVTIMINNEKWRVSYSLLINASDIDVTIVEENKMLFVK